MLDASGSNSAPWAGEEGEGRKEGLRGEGEGLESSEAGSTRLDAIQNGSARLASLFSASASPCIASLASVDVSTRSICAHRLESVFGTIYGTICALLILN